MKTRSFPDGLTLANICEVAANRFHENAVQLKLMKMPALAEQFVHQEQEARELATLFANSEPFEVRYDEST